MTDVHRGEERREAQGRPPAPMECSPFDLPKDMTKEHQPWRMPEPKAKDGHKEAGGECAGALAELTLSAPCIPEGIPLAPSYAAECAAAAASAESSNRLAAVNKFTLNPDEPSRSLQELVQSLQEEISSGRKDLERLYNLMMSYDIGANEWKRFEFYDDKKKYTRNLIASVPGVFCLMLLCWNPEKGSPIHNHSGSECFMRVLKGSIVEYQYVVHNGEGDAAGKQNWSKTEPCSNIPASDLTMTNRNVYKEGGVTFINDSLGVHAIENPYKEIAITLHCYIPGYDTCKSWSQDTTEKDASKAVKIQQCHISYDTEQGERTHA